MTQEQTLSIDGMTYPLSSLSEDAKAQLQMLQVTEQEIQRLQLQQAIAQTARNAYVQALKVHNGTGKLHNGTGKLFTFAKLPAIHFSA